MTSPNAQTLPDAERLFHALIGLTGVKADEQVKNLIRDRKVAGYFALAFALTAIIAVQATWKTHIVPWLTPMLTALDLKDCLPKEPYALHAIILSGVVFAYARYSDYKSYLRLFPNNAVHVSRARMPGLQMTSLEDLRPTSQAAHRSSHKGWGFKNLKLSSDSSSSSARSSDNSYSLDELCVFFESCVKVMVVGPIKIGKSTLVGWLSDTRESLGHAIAHTLGLKFYKRTVKSSQNVIFVDSMGLWQPATKYSPKVSEDFIVDFMSKMDVVIVTFGRLNTNDIPLLKKIIRWKLTAKTYCRLIVLHNLKDINTVRHLKLYVNRMKRILSAEFATYDSSSSSASVVPASSKVTENDAFEEEEEGDDSKTPDEDPSNLSYKDFLYDQYVPVNSQQLHLSKANNQQSIEHYFIGHAGTEARNTTRAAVHVLEQLKNIISSTQRSKMDLRLEVKKTIALLMSKYHIIIRNNNSPSGTMSPRPIAERNGGVDTQRGEVKQDSKEEEKSADKVKNGTKDKDKDEQKGQMYLSAEDVTIDAAGQISFSENKFNQLQKKNGIIGSKFMSSFNLRPYVPKYNSSQRPAIPELMVEIDTAGVNESNVKVNFDDYQDSHRVWVTLEKYNPDIIGRETYVEEVEIPEEFQLAVHDDAIKYANDNINYDQTHNILTFPLQINVGWDKFETLSSGFRNGGK